MIDPSAIDVEHRQNDILITYGRLARLSIRRPAAAAVAANLETAAAKLREEPDD